MSAPDGDGESGGSVGSLRSQRGVIGLGVGAMLVGFVVIPLFPFVVVAVLTWWLADDLRRDPTRRPGWLGGVALGAFAVLAVGSAVVVTLFDAHFDCGGTLGGFGEAADARLDTDCRDGRLWRIVVAGILTVLICAVGFVGVRRSSPSRPPLPVAAGAIGAMLAAVIAVLAVLAAT